MLLFLKLLLRNSYFHIYSMNKIKSIILTLSLLILSAIQASAQDMPVHFTVQQKQVSPTEVQVVFSALIDKGWHVYSTNLPGGGPTPATLHLDKSEGVTPVGKLTFKGKEISKDDNMFGMKLRFFENSVSFIQKFNITEKTSGIIDVNAQETEAQVVAIYTVSGQRIAEPQKGINIIVYSNGKAEKVMVNE